jgi:hypothetical protein
VRERGKSEVYSTKVGRWAGEGRVEGPVEDGVARLRGLGISLLDDVPLTLHSAVRPLVDVTAQAAERRHHSLSRGTMNTTGELTAAVA